MILPLRENLLCSDSRAGQVLRADEGAQQSGGDDPRHAASRCRKSAGEWSVRRLVRGQIQKRTPTHNMFLLLDLKRLMVHLIVTNLTSLVFEEKMNITCKCALLR